MAMHLDADRGVQAAAALDPLVRHELMQALRRKPGSRRASSALPDLDERREAWAAMAERGLPELHRQRAWDAMAEAGPSPELSWYYDYEERLEGARRARDEAVDRGEAVRVAALQRRVHDEARARDEQRLARLAEARALREAEATHRPVRVARATVDGWKAPGCAVDASLKDEECAICLEPLCSDVWRLPCPHGAHHFHRACILPWLKEKRNCVLCRTEFDKNGDPVGKPPEPSGPPPSAFGTATLPAVRLPSLPSRTRRGRVPPPHHAAARSGRRLSG